MKKTHPDSHDPRFGEPEQSAASHEPKHEREPEPAHVGLPNEVLRLQAENTKLRADVEYLQRQLVAPVDLAPTPAVLPIKNRRPNRHQ